MATGNIREKKTKKVGNPAFCPVFSTVLARWHALYFLFHEPLTKREKRCIPKRRRKSPIMMLERFASKFAMTYVKWVTQFMWEIPALQTVSSVCTRARADTTTKNIVSWAPSAIPKLKKESGRLLISKEMNLASILPNM